jgi:excisionase family DNA binding protein
LQRDRELQALQAQGLLSFEFHDATAESTLGVVSADTESISTGEAACYLGIAMRTLYGLVEGGQVIARKHGRVLRYRVSDFDAYIEAVRVKPGEIYMPP